GDGSYSLDEIKTSDTWIDGKPIYKKTLPFSEAIAKEAETQLKSIGTHEYIDTLVDGVLTGKDSNGNSRLLGITFDLYKKANNYFYIYSMSALQFNTNSAGTITIWYTKTDE
ncbi:MAG: hypothetical protein LBE13_18690, partial [Bacteroidales bacterium]|nr:hypothetical protein [Bacteroidales bacterium]